MELFARAKAVRLKSYHDKFLYADEDEVHVTQDRNGSSPNARWAVEQALGAVRLRSRYGRYLCASSEHFLLGMTGRKVLQAAAPPAGAADPTLEWVPVKEGFQARLRTRKGDYLRANGTVPPWRNSVTHDVPHRSTTQDWVLWDVEIVQVLTPGPEHAVSLPPFVSAPPSPPAPELTNPPPPAAHHRPTRSYSEQPPPPERAPPPPPERAPPPRPTPEYAPPPPRPTPEYAPKPTPEYAPPPPRPAPERAPPPRPTLSKLESSDSFSAPLHKVEGRAIHYQIADDHGNVDDDDEDERRTFTFNGTNLEELTRKLQEETGLDDIIICTRSPINGKLAPLRLQLPPNNAAMNIVLVRESSKVAKTFPWPYGP